jgi:transposase
MLRPGQLCPKAATVRREAMQHLEDLPGWANTVFDDLLSEVSRLDERIAQYDRPIVRVDGHVMSR